MLGSRPIDMNSVRGGVLVICGFCQTTSECGGVFWPIRSYILTSDVG